MHYLINAIRHNLSLKMLSLFIALCLWAFVVVKQNPMVVQKFQVRVMVRNAPEGLTVVSCRPTTATVILSGPQRVVEETSPSSLTLVADVSGRSPGEHRAGLTLEDLPNGLSLESITPGEVQVFLDKTVTDTRKVEVRLTGQPANGYQVGVSDTRPGEVKVTGGAAAVAKVVRVVAECSVEGITVGAECLPRLQTEDEDGNPVSGVTIEPPEASVLLSVTREGLARKTVYVEAEIGDPAPGYEVVGVAVSPSSLVVTGDPKKLDQLGRVHTERIDITQVRRSRVFVSGLALPEGVKRVEVGPISVTVTVRSTGQSSSPAGTEPTTPPEGGTVSPPGGEAQPPPSGNPPGAGAEPSGPPLSSSSERGRLPGATRR
ncbi:MAG TPA: CdaR family protein [Armatimonadota bacterium]|jgi:YbbR domain-containing protein